MVYRAIAFHRVQNTRTGEKVMDTQTAECVIEWLQPALEVLEIIEDDAVDKRWRGWVQEALDGVEGVLELARQCAGQA